MPNKAQNKCFILLQVNKIKETHKLKAIQDFNKAPQYLSDLRRNRTEFTTYQDQNEQGQQFQRQVHGD